MAHGTTPGERPEEAPSIIGVDLAEYSQKHGNKSIKKTLTIPAWLNTIAEVNNVNFSQVLQNALKDQLGINN